MYSKEYNGKRKEKEQPQEKLMNINPLDSDLPTDRTLHK